MKASRRSAHARDMRLIGCGAAPDGPNGDLGFEPSRRDEIGAEQAQGGTKRATLAVASPPGESTRRWIERLRGTLAVREVPDRKGLDRVMARFKPDVLVLDLALPGLAGVRNLSAIQRLSPSTGILVLADAPTDTEGVLALKAGVRGYAARTIDPHQLEKAVTAVLNGEVWAPRS